MEKLKDLSELEAYLYTFVGRCGIQSVGFGDYPDILAALEMGMVTPCLWMETPEESVKWDAGRLLEASFRLLVLEGMANSMDDAKGIRQLQTAAKRRFVPHKQATKEKQQDTVLYQLQQDAIQMDFKLTLPEPLKLERKFPYGSDLICGAYLENIRIAIVSPYQETHQALWT
jgi:hypothetical protein